MPKFIEDQRGSIPFTALGLVLLLIATMGVYHFNRMDETRVEQRTARRADMETFYDLAHIAFDIQQEARAAAEGILIRDSIESFAKPIDADSWHGNNTYQSWRDDLRARISKGVEINVLDFYGKHGSDGGLGDERVERDFTNFLDSNGSDFINVEVVPDEFDDVPRKMLLNISLEPSKYIKSQNKMTGFSIAMRDDTQVVVDARPFTMAKAVYDFTGIFKRKSVDIWNFNASKDTVDEFAWYIWAAEEVMGLMEANLRHDVRFATDERATYSLAHMIVAYKEKQHFGTYDYLHLAREVLRPWIGDEEGGREFLGFLKQGIESGYVDQAIGVMESGALASELNTLSWKVNDNVLRVLARLDSSLVNDYNFPKDYLPGGGFIPSRGALQQLRTARDISSLKKAESDLSSMRNSVADAASDPEMFQSHWVGSLSHHRGEVRREYTEFIDDVSKAESNAASATNEMGFISDSLEEMEHRLNESKCESMIAAQLWYGSSEEQGGEGSMGLEDVLSVKRTEAENISKGLKLLEGHIGELSYQEDAGEIDETFESADGDMGRARAALDGASTYQGYYLSCRVSWGRGHSSPTSGCEERRTMEEEYDCGTEEEPATCTRSWKEYRCTCKDYYRTEYADRMSRVGYALLSAVGEIGKLNSSMTGWFDKHGYPDILNKIYEIDGYETGDGLMDFYYNHYKLKLPDKRGYLGAFEFTLNLSDAASSPRSALSYRTGDALGEEFADYGFGYVHSMLTGLHNALNPTGANIEYEKARDALKTMRGDGFFEFLLELITAISDLMNYFGDILNLLSNIDKGYASFPMLRDHLYGSFPLPPIEKSSRGFSLIHEIRLRADNHPAVLEFSLPLVGKRRIALPPGDRPEGGRGYSMPIPFTPLSMYAWGFDVARSQVGSEPLSNEATGEKTTLWLVDYENQGNLAPFAMMRLGNESLPTPVYLHKPLMYKYEFTGGDYADSIGSISKGLKPGKLPPVIIVALGAFATNFRGWVEPPDAGGEYVAMDVALEESSGGITVTARLPTEASNRNGTFILSVHETGGADNSDSLFSKDVRGSLDKMPLVLVLKKTDLSQLKTHGWSFVSADLYALDEKKISSDTELSDHAIGEDHASLPIIDSTLKADVRITDYDGESIGVANEGNRRVEVVLTATGGCCFFESGSIWERGLWTGTLDAGEARRIKIKPVGPVALELKADVPLEVQRLIQNSSGMRLQDYYKVK